MRSVVSGEEDTFGLVSEEEICDDELVVYR